MYLYYNILNMCWMYYKIILSSRYAHFLRFIIIVIYKKKKITLEVHQLFFIMNHIVTIVFFTGVRRYIMRTNIIFGLIILLYKVDPGRYQCSDDHP